MNEMRFPPDYECHFQPILPRIRELAEPLREKYLGTTGHMSTNIHQLV